MRVRRSARVQVQCPCSFSGVEVAGEGVVINLSRPGCAVETGTPIGIGSRIELHLLLPIHFFPVAVNHAEVVWSTATKFGVKFVRIRPEDEARLQRFIEQSLRSAGGPSLAPGSRPTDQQRPVAPAFTLQRAVAVTVAVTAGGPRLRPIPLPSLLPSPVGQSGSPPLLHRCPSDHSSRLPSERAVCLQRRDRFAVALSAPYL